MKRYVLDSYAMIAFFEDEPGAGRVARVLRQLIQGKAKGFMSVVNWGEVYYNTMREEGVAEAEKVILQLEKFPIKIVEVDKDFAYEAAKLKGEYRMAYADCAYSDANRPPIPLQSGRSFRSKPATLRLR